MKLKIEKHPDFIRLAQHFKNIEALADALGVDVDDLISETREKYLSDNHSYQESIQLLLKNRASRFNSYQQNNNCRFTKTGMTVLAK